MNDGTNIASDDIILKPKIPILVNEEFPFNHISDFRIHF